MSALTTNVDAIDQQILDMLSHGYSRPQIAETLDWHVYKVDARIQELMEHYDVHNAAHLVAKALRDGMIS